MRLVCAMMWPRPAYLAICDFLCALGIEYFTDLTAHQRQLAQVAIDAGADLVVGAHPHVIEPYEFYKGKLIVYSLGNFVFDYMDAEVVRRGDILSLTIQKNRLLAWELVPTHTGNQQDLLSYSWTVDGLYCSYALV